jgi:hypothetical protein
LQRIEPVEIGVKLVTVDKCGSMREDGEISMTVKELKSLEEGYYWVKHTDGTKSVIEKVKKHFWIGDLEIPPKLLKKNYRGFIKAEPPEEL